MSNTTTLDMILRPLEREQKSTSELDFYDQHIAISTSNFLRFLASQALEVQFIEFYADDRDDQFDQIFGGAEGEGWKQDNTYNYNEPWSDAMCVAITKDIDTKGDYKIAFAPHYGGDVRGNYGNFIVLTFDSFYDYAETSSDYFYNQAYVFKLGERSFICYYSGAGESYNLCEIGGEFQSDGFIPERWTEDDFIKSVRNEIGE